MNKYADLKWKESEYGNPSNKSWKINVKPIYLNKPGKVNTPRYEHFIG